MPEYLVLQDEGRTKLTQRYLYCTILWAFGTCAGQIRFRRVMFWFEDPKTIHHQNWNFSWTSLTSDLRTWKHPKFTRGRLEPKTPHWTIDFWTKTSQVILNNRYLLATCRCSDTRFRSFGTGSWTTDHLLHVRIWKTDCQVQNSE